MIFCRCFQVPCFVMITMWLCQYRSGDSYTAKKHSHLLCTGTRICQCLSDSTPTALPRAHPRWYAVPLDGSVANYPCTRQLSGQRTITCSLSSSHPGSPPRAPWGTPRQAACSKPTQIKLHSSNGQERPRRATCRATCRAKGLVKCRDTCQAR